MKILFAGTPDIAVPSLQAIANNYDVAAVLTTPDRASGRRRKIQFSPVKTAALELGLPIIQPQRLDAAAREEIMALKSDILVVFAYGRIFGPKFLALFPMGGINMHPSALPRYRGPSPLTAAILNGDTEIAMTVQRIVLEMDAGDIIRQTPFKLDGTETTGFLTDRAAVLAAEELTAALRDLLAGETKPIPQDPGGISYCRIISKEDGIVDWQCSAVYLERMVRAYYPWPKARAMLDTRSIAILESCVVSDKSENKAPLCGTVLGVNPSQGILVQTGSGVLGLLRLQAASKKPVDFRSFMHGVNIEPGMRFESAS